MNLGWYRYINCAYKSLYDVSPNRHVATYEIGLLVKDMGDTMHD